MTGAAVDFNQIVVGCIAVQHPPSDD